LTGGFSIGQGHSPSCKPHFSGPKLLGKMQDINRRSFNLNLEIYDANNK